jgi:hypothetical protein
MYEQDIALQQALHPYNTAKVAAGLRKNYEE